ncbi:hypothetical protein D1007_34713 [Hordeum vulgare]|nr:hypothetical protein D1007_34713 [Hordeum vulgare]
MSCLSWNAGAWNPGAVRELRKHVKQEVPGLFLVEPKITTVRVECLQNQLGFAGCFAVSSVGLSGGLGLFWTTDFEVDPMSYSAGHIDVWVRRRSNNKKWRMTGFYGAPRVEDRHLSWSLLRTLFAVQHEGWMCIGDFNETLQGSEHFSRSARPERQMLKFREAMDDCLLQDLGWIGAD